MRTLKKQEIYDPYFNMYLNSKSGEVSGSHFHDCIDCTGVAFSIELLEWVRTFADVFLG